MSQSSTTGFLQYCPCKVLHNSLSTPFNNSGNDIYPVPLGEEAIREARTEGVKLSLGRRAGAVFFLTALLSLTSKEFIFPKSVCPCFSLSSLPTNFPCNALNFPLEEREEQLMCSWQPAEAHPTALGALSWFSVSTGNGSQRTDNG